ncbi:hypothetical protein Syun_006160 [Stephania yunnanensis]|uniref:Uncharacterized protein n=1 Tax=Stephania yunnanensis TaxID=152371 RepID=A0AAP0PZ21_9MAGN
MSSDRSYDLSSNEGSGDQSSGRSNATRDRQSGGSHRHSHDDATLPTQASQGH